MNQNVVNLKAYHLTPDTQNIKLNQNEFPEDWPEEVKKQLTKFIDERPFNRYPTFIPERLKECLAEYNGVSKDSIIVGNGSNEMLLCLMLSIASSQRSVIICEPTFTVYNMLASGMGCEVHKTSLNDDLTYNIERLLEASEACGRQGMMIICSPNNPTGCSLSEDEITRLVEYHEGFVILDQAYVEFGGYNGIPLIEKYPNLIITRTFSKAFGGAGFRLGYMIGHEEIITHINKIKLPYNINFITEFAGELLVSQKELLKERIDTVILQRDKLYTDLKELPFETVYPSEGNFFITRTPYKDELFQYLKDNDILVRDVSSYKLLENCLRISVGTAEENSLLVKNIREFFKTK